LKQKSINGICVATQTPTGSNRLHHHLAGAAHARELLEGMCDDYSGEPLGAFAIALLVELEADRELRGQKFAKVTKSEQV
jgi:hypothetical protein